MPASDEWTAAPWGDAGPTVRFDAALRPDDRTAICRLLGEWSAALFGGGSIRVSILVGGANNRNFVVESPEGKYALRIANEQNERFAVDRASALRAQEAAAAAGLAPPVVAARLPEGHVLSRFVEGETLLDPASLRDRRLVELCGHTFCRLHGLTADIRDFSPFTDISLWISLARDDGTALPEDIAGLQARVEEVEKLLRASAPPAVFCHNDTVPQNFIASDGALVLVDWDYAGRAPARFELASFCATAGLDAELEDVMLTAYDRGTTEAQRASIWLLRFVAAMRETSWALMATPLLRGTTTPPGERNFYDDYLRTHLALAREMANSERFEESLAGASREKPGVPW